MDDRDIINVAKGATIVKSPAEIAREIALKGAQPELAKTIEAQIARSKKFGEQLGLENPYEVYFPFIKKDKLDRFINETKGIRVGSEGYRKQFKNLLTNENMELDPAKAFFIQLRNNPIPINLIKESGDFPLPPCMKRPAFNKLGLN
ncbi:MAG: hypothetical protein AAB646_01800 [Patescibacteria group bacterium]